MGSKMMKLVKRFSMKKIGLMSLVTSLAASSAFADEAMHAASGGDMKAAGIGLALGIAALGGALGQGKIGASAMDGIARNPAAQPKMFVPMIIGMALIESFVLYAFVIAFLKI